MPRPMFTRGEGASPYGARTGAEGGGGGSPWTPTSGLGLGGGVGPGAPGVAGYDGPGSRSSVGGGSRGSSPAREVVSAGGKVMRISVRSPGGVHTSGGLRGGDAQALTPAQALDSFRRHMLPPSPWARVSSHVSFMRSERVALAVILASAGVCVCDVTSSAAPPPCFNPVRSYPPGPTATSPVVPSPSPPLSLARPHTQVSPSRPVPCSPAYPPLECFPWSRAPRLCVPSHLPSHPRVWVVACFYLSGRVRQLGRRW
jgi:hypothetical protein